MEDDANAPFWSHIEELRLTLLRIMAIILIGMVACFIFYSQLIGFLTSPLASTLVLLGPLEGISTAIKISLWIGAFATSPIWLFVLLQFIAPALHKHEKKLILPFLLLSILFVAIGCSFAFMVTIPIANIYLIGFNDSIGENLWSLAHYLDYTLFLLLANGLAFELCVVGLFTVHLGMISAKSLSANRRFAIVAAFIIGALLTPPDILTQIMLAIPLIILYEFIILYARFKGMPRSGLECDD